MLDDYVARANSAVTTYNATGDTGPCDNLANDMFVIRAEFGRQTFSPHSKWYRQYANLWGCYTNLCQWVGITAMMTLRLTTSTIAWRRSPYDERSRFCGSPVAQP